MANSLVPLGCPAGTKWMSFHPYIFVGWIRPLNRWNSHQLTTTIVTITNPARHPSIAWKRGYHPPFSWPLRVLRRLLPGVEAHGRDFDHPDTRQKIHVVDQKRGMMKGDTWRIHPMTWIRSCSNHRKYISPLSGSGNVGPRTQMAYHFMAPIHGRFILTTC